MPGFRSKGPNEDEFGDYIHLDFKKKETYIFLYHVIATVALGWPAHWMKKKSEKHQKWVSDEYNVEIFKKRIDGQENL